MVFGRAAASSLRTLLLFRSSSSSSLSATLYSAEVARVLARPNDDDDDVGRPCCAGIEKDTGAVNAPTLSTRVEATSAATPTAAVRRAAALGLGLGLGRLVPALGEHVGIIAADDDEGRRRRIELELLPQHDGGGWACAGRRAPPLALGQLMPSDHLLPEADVGTCICCSPFVLSRLWPFFILFCQMQMARREG